MSKIKGTWRSLVGQGQKMLPQTVVMSTHLNLDLSWHMPRFLLSLLFAFLLDPTCPPALWI